MTTQTPTVGRIVHLVVPRHTNGGQDHVPAIITKVIDSEHIAVHAFRAPGYPDTVADVRLLPDRAKVGEALAYHYKDLPGGRVHEHPDGRQEQLPGINSMSGQPWNHSDVAHWHAYAYWPGREDQAAAPEDKAAPAESTDDRRARLVAELAELDAAAQV